jgi:hypothetical protein
MSDEKIVCPVPGCGASGEEQCATPSGRNHHGRNVLIALKDEPSDWEASMWEANH